MLHIIKLTLLSNCYDEKFNEEMRYSRTFYLRPLLRLGQCGRKRQVVSYRRLLKYFYRENLLGESMIIALLEK